MRLSRAFGRRLPEESDDIPARFILQIKARWGKDGGTGGRKRPLRASRDRRRPQAVPVATKEATGIDSRDKGVSFPPKESFRTLKTRRKGGRHERTRERAC